MPGTPDYLQAPPPLLELKKNGTNEPTEEFGRLFRKMYGIIIANYPLGSDAWRVGPSFRRQEVKPPTDDVDQYLNKLDDSPDWEQALAHEFWTSNAALQKKHWRIEDGRKLYGHQQADLAFIPWQLATGQRRSYAAIINCKPGGSGKTLPLGQVLLNTGRMQMRDAIAGRDCGLVVFCTARPTHMVSQAFSQKQQALRSPPHTIEHRHVLRYYRDCTFLFGEDFKRLFPLQVFESLFEKQRNDVAGCAIIKKVLQERGTWNDVRDMEHPMMLAIMQLIDGDKIVLRSIYNTPAFVDPPPFAGKGDSDVSAYNGDATRGIRRGTPVLAGRPEWQIEDLPEGKLPWIYLTTTSMFTSAASRERNAPHLKRTRVVGCDELWSGNPESFWYPVMQAGARRPPIFFGNNAIDSGRHPAIRCGTLSVVELIRRGIFGNVGYDVFPGANERLARVGTEEAYTQFESTHFEHFKALDAMHLPQPYLCDSVIIAPNQNDGVREYAHRLQRQYDEREIPVELFCYDGTAGNDREMIELWFKASGKNPKILVASPAFMQHTVDFPNLRNMTIATTVNAMQRKGIFERLMHSQLERLYFREQIFAGDQSTLIRSPSLNHGLVLPDAGLAWPSLQCLLDEQAYQADQKTLPKTHRKLARLVPDAKPAKPKTFAESTPLKATSTFVVERQKKSAERRAQHVSRAPLAAAPAPRAPAQSIVENETPPPVVAREPVTYEAVVQVGEEERRLSLTVDETGKPSSAIIAEIAQEHGIPEYTDGLTKSVEFHHGMRGLRGDALAHSTLIRVIELQKFQAYKLHNGKRFS